MGLVQKVLLLIAMSMFTLFFGCGVAFEWEDMNSIYLLTFAIVGFIYGMLSCVLHYKTMDVYRKSIRTMVSKAVLNTFIVVQLLFLITLALVGGMNLLFGDGDLQGNIGFFIFCALIGTWKGYDLYQVYNITKNLRRLSQMEGIDDIKGLEDA